MDVVTRERFAEFIGRDPHPSGAGRDVLHIKQPNYPQFRFEWHPGTRKVYLIRVGSKPLIGEKLAEHAETHAEAYAYVQTFLRGFREGQAPDLPKLHLEG